jgi:hypothetical protein
VFILLIITMTLGEAGQIRLSWSAPTKDEEGMPLTNLAGYKLYYGQNSRQVSGSYASVVDVGNQTSHTLSGLTDGQRYYFAVTAYNTVRDESDYSNEANGIASSPSSNPSGLVAAYNFNEGSGTTLTDRSGGGRHGTIANATWTASGKYGRALTFNGYNSWVTVGDAPTLDLTTGMTLEAWVYPTTSSGARDVLIKEGPSMDIYNLYARNSQGLAELYAYTPNGGNYTAEGSTVAAYAWTHLAGTYDGSMLRLYRNGVEVARQARSAPMATSGGVLRIGGNSLWGEFFRGHIDEVRIYNRALSPSAIQADMNTPVD